MSRRPWVAAVLAAAILLTILGAVTVARVAATLPDVSFLARRTPTRTALMRQRLEEAHAAGRPARLDLRWVAYPSISPLLRRAVLIAEDDAFFSHDGLDWNEIRASVRQDLKARRFVRGASTITQQLARNLFLGNQRTLTRKLREVLIARRLERALTKRRIFELYLNLIEWGDGVYGVEAAARTHFGVSAASLDAGQAARLAAVIINPRRFDPANPVPRIQRRARMILDRMWRRGLLSETEYDVAIGRTPPATDLPSATAPEPPVDTSAAPASSRPHAPDSAGAPSDTTPP